MKVLISTSFLSCDFSRLDEEIAEVLPFTDMLHVDVMDGHFVPNITFGPPLVASLKSGRPLDVHLMIEKPQDYLEEFAKAISLAHGRKDDSYIIVHQEACHHLHRAIQQIKELGCKAAVALNPLTPLYTIEPILNELDMVLLMTVNPGFGGQEFIKSVLEKIRDLRTRAPKLNIEVDGGINDKTARLAKKAGANILVAGAYIMKSKDRAQAVESLR
ncbi:ribulose-phosphate 3-epimerase [Candidatus Peregrinibacteria bacterium]|nr:ribulose-phosphate 3-epimerase [Candidatus Peregrinibacteria bacterium]